MEPTETLPPSVFVDLPNYAWNHANEYWHESESSKEWRFRKFPVHDLLGTKLLGTSWSAPSWSHILSLDSVLWLKDHRMGPDILFPAAGYISMAVEAVYQMAQHDSEATIIVPIHNFAFRLRNINFTKALVLNEDASSKVMPNLTALSGADSVWYQFKISSVQGETYSEHCHGLARLDTSQSPASASKDQVRPLEHSTAGSLWYKTLTDIGYSFGPSFRRVEGVEALPGQRASRSIVSFEEPSTAYPVQSVYSIHPACVDGCFHTTLPSLWNGERSSADAVLVPASIDSMYIGPRSLSIESGLSNANAEYGGRGRPEQAKNYVSNCSVFDQESRKLLLQVTGFRCYQLDVSIDVQAAHTYVQSLWETDDMYMDQAHIKGLPSDDDDDALRTILDLFAHKWPNMKILEAAVSLFEVSSTWFDRSSSFKTRPYREYLLASSDPKGLVALQNEYGSRPKTSFNLMDLSETTPSCPEWDFDLIIVKTAKRDADIQKVVVENSGKLLAPGGSVLLLEQSSTLVNGNGVNQVNGMDASKETNKGSIEALEPLSIPCELYSRSSLIRGSNVSTYDSCKSVSVISLRPAKSGVASISAGLQEIGWVIEPRPPSLDEVRKDSLVLIVDVLFQSIFPSINPVEWEQARKILTCGARLLWVTLGSQFEVSQPDRAMIHGLLRTVRNEDPSLPLTTLDVESADGSSTVTAISKILSTMSEEKTKIRHTDNEFTERRGLIHVNRLLPLGTLQNACASCIRPVERASRT